MDDKAQAACNNPADNISAAASVCHKNILFENRETRRIFCEFESCDINVTSLASSHRFDRSYMSKKCLQ